MNPMKVPELLREIAAFVDTPRDLSQFVQVDRFTNAVGTSCLYRYIDIPLDSVESLALTLRNNPERAVGCRSLSFCKPYHELEGGTFMDEESLFMDLITVFDAISAHGQLATLRWRWNCRRFRGRWVGFPEEVWTAISSVLSPLRALELCFNSADKLVWRSITCARFTQLRVFRLYLPDAERWNCDHLQTMLDTLCSLEELSLEFPLSDGPRGITLGSTYPHLKRFTFSGSALFPESDFLVRHPMLETLLLETTQPFRVSQASTAMLRILSADEDSLIHSPAVVNSQITHLGLRDLTLTRAMVLDTIRSVARTLRCLELEVLLVHVGDVSDCIVPHIPAILAAAPALDELAIIPNLYAHLSNWSTKLLADLLPTLDPTSSLRALRLGNLWQKDDAPLPQVLLDDLGPLPPRMRYIGWDVGAASLVYVIQRQDGKNSVSNTLTRSMITEDWTAENVLHYVGEHWTEQLLP
ncbi:hypothetical protein FB451DRAFT_1256963 [Mycena latifolia]|nr:hypothetical protein FB451DRAFT_1256963 [Mycena latifolia]